MRITLQLKKAEFLEKENRNAKYVPYQRRILQTI